MLNIDNYIALCASKLSLNIIRDGTQSAEGNRLRHSDILQIVQKIDAYMHLLQQSVSENIYAVCESWGGASVIEPVRLNGEDSFENLENILKAAPHTPHSCLYRGTQGFGYMPLSRQDQAFILDAVSKMGIYHFRVFDMMNDVDNLKSCVETLHDLNKTLNNRLIIELAICANSESDKIDKLRNYPYYQSIITNYLSLKPHRLAIKDYSGLCQFDELHHIISIIRQYDKKIPIAVHSHTEKSDILAHSLILGANSVDVGMSAWAGGNAHSDYFKTLYAYLKLSGFNIDDYSIIQKIESHPLIIKARAIESLCDLIAPPYKAIRVLEQHQPHKEILFKAKIASGGIVAMRDMLKQNLKIARPYLEKSLKQPPSESHLMDVSLHKMAQLWEDAGRPDTVTPGSLILSRTANILTFQEIVYQKVISLKDISQDYKDLVMGRYGKNLGFEAGFGNQQLRNLFFLENGIKAFIIYCNQKNYSLNEYKLFIKDHQIPDLYDLQHNPLEEMQKQATSWLILMKHLLKDLQFPVCVTLLNEFTAYRFYEPKSIYPQAKQFIENLVYTGIISHAYSGYKNKKWLSERLILLAMIVKHEFIESMIKFKSDGIITGQIENDPRAIFWRDTICSENVREAYQNLVYLMKFYPPGRMTRANSALRARKRRTLSLKMTEIGIENNFKDRSNIHNIYYVHKLIAQKIIKAKQELSHALEWCIIDYDEYDEYQSKIIASVIKQAMLDAINQ
jgi:pyruvate/oxaloacetate carboxyltransferase